MLLKLIVFSTSESVIGLNSDRSLYSFIDHIGGVDNSASAKIHHLVIVFVTTDCHRNLIDIRTAIYWTRAECYAHAQTPRWSRVILATPTSANGTPSCDATSKPGRGCPHSTGFWTWMERRSERAKRSASIGRRSWWVESNGGVINKLICSGLEVSNNDCELFAFTLTHTRTRGFDKHSLIMSASKI